MIEASGASPAVANAPDVARRAGTVVFVGLAGDGEVPIDVVELIHRELDVTTSFRYANTYPTAIDLLDDSAVDVAGLVDFESSLGEITSAFERATDSETVKGMIRI